MKKKYRTTEVSIKDFMDKVIKGEYSIPTYQREYVWKSNKISDLLQSIVKGFPIGTITTTNINDESLLARGRNEIFDVLNKNDKTYVNAIVDGQQRITSIAIVYFALDIKRDIKNFDNPELIKVIKKTINNIYLYEGIIYDKKDLVKFLSEKEDMSISGIEDKIANLVISDVNINRDLRNIIDNYSIENLKLFDWNDNEIIDIFIAMNKGGKPLTHIELMNGSMFNIDKNFSLIDFFSKEVKKRIGPSFSEIKNEYLIQLMKVFYDLTEFSDVVNYKKKELIRFSMEPKDVRKFINIKNLFIDYLCISIGILNDEFGIYSLSQLPKNVYLTSILAYCVMNKGEIKKNKEKLKKIIRRISIRMLDGHYASSPGTRNMEDINNYIIPLIRNGIVNDEESLPQWNNEKIKEKLIEKIDVLTYKNKTQGISKLFISILIMKKPKYIFENKYVSVKSEVGSKIDKDLHHFIPSNSKMAIDFSLNNKHADYNIDSIKNLSIISSEENRVNIINKNINEYLKDSYEKLGENKFLEMITSHYFDIDIIKNILEYNKNSDDNGNKMKDILRRLFQERSELVIQEIMLVFFNDK